MSENISSVQAEIDSIIAQAMAEYSAARGIPVFGDQNVSQNTEVNAVEQPAVEEPPVEEVIPTNSNSILVDETTSRFSSAIWFDNVQGKDVTLAGLGGIGSYVAFLLSRLNIASMTVYDDDVVESGNMSGQMFRNQDIGTYKVSAIRNEVYDFSLYSNVNCINDRFTISSPCTKIAICGFDNMQARRDFYAVWKTNVLQSSSPAEYLFIDGRLAAESFQVLCIRGDDTYNMNRYENEFLFSDEEAEETLCSYKQTSFMANMIASVMVNLFVNFCANQCDPLIPRDLPFFTEYQADTMFFKVTN